MSRHRWALVGMVAAGMVAWPWGGPATSWAASRPAVSPQTRVLDGVVYRSVSGERLRLDAYLPGSQGQAPAVVLLHPGGFAHGDRASMAPLARSLAGRGYATFAIDYRLAPRFPYPAAVLDAGAAVAFVRSNARQYGVDPGRIGLFGASAGATIAVTAAMAGQGPWYVGSRVAAVVSWSAAFDLLSVARERPHATRGLQKYAGATPAEWAAPVPPPETVPLLLRAAPLAGADPSDPPAFVANAHREFMPLPQAEAAAARLRGLGVPVQLFEPPHGHAQRYTGLALGPTLAFLDRYLRGYRAPIASPGTTAPSAAPRQPPATTGGGTGWLVEAGVAGLGLTILGLGAFAFVKRRR